MVSTGCILKHQESFAESNMSLAQKKLQSRIKPPKRISDLLQFTDPYHLNVFVKAYHKKGIVQRKKVEIVTELKKYYTPSIIDFFQKINDCDNNNQVRKIAFNYLQSVGAFVRLRKKFKGKTKPYQIDVDSFDVTPEHLVQELKNSNLQSMKEYDVFISHSYRDKSIVKKVKDELNSRDLNIYCDWTNDNDYLKRELASDYTEIVLIERIKQCKSILFLQTDNSIDAKSNIKSEWVKMEIKQAQKLDKNIYCLNFTNQNSLFKEIKYSMDKAKIVISIEGIEGRSKASNIPLPRLGL